MKKRIFFITICIIFLIISFYNIKADSILEHNLKCNLCNDIEYIPKQEIVQNIIDEENNMEIEIEVIPEEQLEAEVVDPSQYDPVPSIVYTNTDVNVRNMPSIDGEIENVLSLNTELTKVGTNGDWTIIAGEDDRNHYIHTSCISTEKTEKEIRIASRSAKARTDGNGRSLGIYSLTAYCGCASCCGKSNGITASGTRAAAGRTIAAPSNFAFGTKLQINGHIYTVEDRGGAIKGNRIDIYFNSHSEALAFGRRSTEVFIIE